MMLDGLISYLMNSGNVLRRERIYRGKSTIRDEHTELAGLVASRNLDELQSKSAEKQYKEP